MDQITCEIIDVAQTIQRIVLDRATKRDDEDLQVIGCYEKTYKASPDWPVCGVCERLVHGMPDLLAVFRKARSRRFATSGICHRCTGRDLIELERVAMEFYSASMLPTVGRA